MIINLSCKKNDHTINKQNARVLLHSIKMYYVSVNKRTDADFITFSNITVRRGRKTRESSEKTELCDQYFKRLRKIKRESNTNFIFRIAFSGWLCS